MGAKKGKKGKKGKKAKGVTDDLDALEKNFVLQAEIESLQMRVVRQTEISNMAVGAERELREKDKQLQWAVKDEKQRTNDIVADMTRQYKATSDELMHQTNELDAKAMANDNEIKELTATRDQIRADHKQIEESKDGQI